MTAEMERAIELDLAGNIDQAIDVAFDWIDQQFADERFNEIDVTLAELTLIRPTIAFYMAILSITKPAKDRLPMRGMFVSMTRSRCVKRRKYSLLPMLEALA